MSSLTDTACLNFRDLKSQICFAGYEGRLKQAGNVLKAKGKQ